jgi:predicted  nucleic acid-binding Zn-ribbon protein
MTPSKKDLEEMIRIFEIQNTELHRQNKELEDTINQLMDANQKLADMITETNQRTSELFELINQHGFDNAEILDGKYLLLAYSTKQYRSN